jgi:16S rRNA G966 N2-methylase RsmD
VLKCDAEAAVELLYKQGQRFELVFVDPPYNKGWIQKILAKLVKCPLLADNGWLIAEHSMHDDIVGAVPEGYEIFRSQQYGETVLSFLRKSA